MHVVGCQKNFWSVEMCQSEVWSMGCVALGEVVLQSVGSVVVKGSGFGLLHAQVKGSIPDEGIK